MTKMKKKHTRGMATAFLSQKQAMRRLQLGLPNFRRVCILKGVYPVEPSNKKKAGKGSSQPKIYFNTKDIGFLANEPLIEKFRKLRVYQLKLKKARERKDKEKEFRIRMNKPRYTLHHVVKERYPTPEDAVADLSDSLNLVFLFSRLPRLTQFSPMLIGLSRRLCVEFLNLVVATKALRKILSCLTHPIKRLDALESEGAQMDDLTELQAIDEQVAVAVNKQLDLQRVQNLFKGKRFFLMREVPREVVCLIVRSCGGECSWEKTVGPGHTFSIDDPKVDYVVVDRPMKEMKVTRYYVQPQWIFDSLNARRLLPAQDYLPGANLPAHLSPFAVGSGLGDLLSEDREATASQRGGLTGVAPGFGEGASLYKPPEADYLAGLVSLAEIRGSAVQARVDHNVSEESHAVVEDDAGQFEVPDQQDSDASMSDEPPKQKTSSKKQSNTKLRKAAKGEKPIITPGRTESKAFVETQEKADKNTERKLREMLLPKKHKNVYKKMVHSIKRKDKEVRQLTERRRAIDAKKK